MWHIHFYWNPRHKWVNFHTHLSYDTRCKDLHSHFFQFMFELVRYVPIDSFSVKLGRVLGQTSIKQRIKCLAFWYNTVPASRKQSSTLTLSLYATQFFIYFNMFNTLHISECSDFENQLCDTIVSRADLFVQENSCELRHSRHV